MNGKLGNQSLGEFKLGDSELDRQPFGPGVMGGMGRLVLGDDRLEDEEELLLFVLTQV